MPITHTNPKGSAKRVLVIKLSALGDFVLALGAMAEVRQYHPNAHITLLTTPPFAEFAAASPYFDTIETDGRPKGLRETTKLVKRIRSINYDIIYDFQTSGRTANYFKAMGGLFSKAPLWSGHAQGCAFPHIGEARKTMHSIDRLARQLEIAGLGPEAGYPEDKPPMPDLTWVMRSKDRAPSLSPAYFGLKPPYALLIPGASATREAKRWPAERYAAVAKDICDQGISLAIIGGTSEGDIARAILKKEPRAKNLATRTSLFQIVGLAKEARFVIGNDTGPMHMATLSGAPGVALFATEESSPEHAAPRGSNVVIVKARIMTEVRVRDVIQAISTLNL